jgi:hypothetical protein
MHARIYKHTYMYRYKSTYLPTYILIYLSTYHNHTHPQIYVLPAHLHTYLPTSISTYIHAHLPTYPPLYLPTYPLTCMYLIILLFVYYRPITLTLPFKLIFSYASSRVHYFKRYIAQGRSVTGQKCVYMT